MPLPGATQPLAQGEGWLVLTLLASEGFCCASSSFYLFLLLILLCFFYYFSSFPAGTGHGFYNRVSASNVALTLGQAVTLTLPFSIPSLLPALSILLSTWPGGIISTRWDLSWPLNCFFLHPAPSREKCLVAQSHVSEVQVLKLEEVPTTQSSMCWMSFILLLQLFW